MAGLLSLKGVSIMQKHVPVLITSLFVLAYGAIAASAQQAGGPMMQHPVQQTIQQQPQPRSGITEGQRRAAEDEDHDRHGGRMMGCGRAGMMGMIGGGMGQGTMGAPVMMRMIFSLMDADGDGTVSLDEFKAAHERIFKAMDADKDGTLTLDEMLAFMRGTTRSAARP
jgi:EF hand